MISLPALQIRLPDGSNMVQKFKAKEPLSAVRVYVDLNRKDGLASATGPAKLMTNFPKKIFSDEGRRIQYKIYTIWA